MKPMSRADTEKDIILINPQSLDGMNYTNIGLASIESFLNQNRIDCTVIHRTEIDDNIDRSNVFGISVMDHTYLSAKGLTQRLQNKTIIWGGWTPTAIPEFVLEDNPGVDYVILQEGEKRLLNLLRSFKQAELFDQIDGIAYRDGKNKIVTKPAVEYMNMEDLTTPTDMTILDELVFFELSRGCYGKCRYCQEEHKMRFKSVTKSVDEIKSWYDRGYRNFYLGNANTIARGQLLQELVRELEKKALKIRLSLVGRPDGVLKQYNILKEYFESKIIYVELVEVGIEANTQHALDLLGRETTPEMNRKAIAALIDLKKKYSPGTLVHANIILFSHFDMSIDDFVENVRFIGDYQCSRNCLVSRLEGMANTPIWHDMKERGFKPDRNMGLRISEYHFTDKEIDRLYRKLTRAVIDNLNCKKVNFFNRLFLVHLIHDKVLDFYNSQDIKNAVLDYIHSSA